MTVYVRGGGKPALIAHMVHEWTITAPMGRQVIDRADGGVILNETIAAPARRGHIVTVMQSLDDALDLAERYRFGPVRIEDDTRDGLMGRWSELEHIALTEATLTLLNPGDTIELWQVETDYVEV